MTDLLTHVLIVYVVLAPAARARFTDGLPIAPGHVSLGMIGAVIPDLSKIHYVIDIEFASRLVGVPLSPLPFHRLGGIVAVIAIGTLLFDRTERRTACGVMLFGAGTHLVLDAFVKRADGLTPPYLYPLSWWQAPAGDLYLSSDVWPSGVALTLAVGVWAAINRHRIVAGVGSRRE